MQIELNQAELTKAVADVQSVVERRNSIQILSNIKIDAKDDKISFTGTDLDILITKTITGKIVKAGTLTVSAQKFYDIVKKLSSEELVKITADDEKKQIAVKSGRSKFLVSYIESDQFPLMNEGDVKNDFKLPSSELFSLINKCQYAISREETRYYLNGVFLHEIDGKLRMVATDGHRLARIETNAPEGSKDLKGVIIPRKTILEIKRIIDQQEDEVEIKLADNKIIFILPNIKIISKLIDGTFPDYEQAIPDNNNIKAIINRENLAKSIDRVSAISDEKTRGIKFHLINNILSLSVRGSDSDEAKEEIEVDYKEESPLEIGFNARYTHEMLMQFTKEETEFAFQNNNAPTLVKEIGNDNALYVLMPMRF